jgi:bicarbonate transport system ATP-binding protein
VAVLALGVLAAALVKIAGKSGSTRTTITTTLPLAATPAPTATTKAPTSTQIAPGTRISPTGSGGSAPSSTTPGAGGKASSPSGATGFGLPGLATGHSSTPATPTTPHTTSAPKSSTPTTGSANGEVARRLRELLDQVRKQQGK